MESRRWLERVERELAGQGLPAGVRARLLAELRDHLEDLTEEGGGMATEAEIDGRMGGPKGLAAAAADHRRAAGWARRHPLLAFGLAPVPAAALAAALYGLGVLALWMAAGAAGYEGASFPAAAALVSGLGFVPFLLTAAVLGRLAARSGVGRHWELASVCQVALLAGAAMARLSWPGGEGEPMLVLGVGVPLAAGWTAVAQLVLTLAAGWLAARVARRRSAVPA
jgi:hypothetical protein